MKKLIFVGLVAIFSLSVLSISFCEEMDEGKGAEVKEHRMGMARMMMKKKMMSREIVATQDGGVVVMMGNKLIKYDKNLNLVKETELKIDMEAMKRMMEEMKENCPMSGKMQEKE